MVSMSSSSFSTRETPIAFACSLIRATTANQGPSGGKGVSMITSYHIGSPFRLKSAHCGDNLLNGTSPLKWLRSFLKIDVKTFLKASLSRWKKRYKQQTNVCFERVHGTWGPLSWKLRLFIVAGSVNKNEIQKLLATSAVRETEGGKDEHQSGLFTLLR